MTLIDKAEALLPCPFCGSRNVRSFLHIATQIDPCVMCRDCNSSAASKSAWNRRAALPDIDTFVLENSNE